MAYLKDFYLSLGFEVEGEEFLEENIPHIRFIKHC
jgi:predicted GNAT family N-acyltransferase